MKNMRSLFCGVSLFVCMCCSQVEGVLAQESAKSSDIKLAVFSVVDQLPYEYLVRFRPLFKGGFKRLLDEGAVFSSAFHNHSNTETCPGHATLISGAYPRHSGIVANAWYDMDKGKYEYCVADEQFKASPANLLVEVLPDWIKAHSAEARVFSVSGKDRSAIMLGGKRADNAFWYDKETGEFKSNGYYKGEVNSSLKDFNKRNISSYWGRQWEPIHDYKPLLNKYALWSQDSGRFSRTFPYPLGAAALAPDPEFYSGFYKFPFLDEHTLAFTKRVIQSERLAEDAHTNFLGVSFSALDLVGHEYGPNSPEVLDTLLRLDLVLGEFLEFLDTAVGRERYVLVLGADHGVTPLPEYRDLKRLPARRQKAEDIACLQRLSERVKHEFGEHEWFVAEFSLNPQAREWLGDTWQTFQDTLSRWMKECPWVERVYTSEELSVETAPTDVPLRYFWNNHYAPRGSDFYLQYRPYYVPSFLRGTGHGSVYDYDRNVPVIFFGNGVEKKTITEPIETVDVAPTMAAMLGVPPLGKPDGKNRSSLFLRSLP